ncbi:MAG: hypothetical protein U0531_01595 [Dehalococcoidia bacterium]
MDYRLLMPDVLAAEHERRVRRGERNARLLAGLPPRPRRRLPAPRLPGRSLVRAVLGRASEA